MASLRDKIANALGLVKGGITDHDSPANEHYYFENEVIDHHTDAVTQQKINFELEIESLIELFEESSIELYHRAYKEGLNDGLFDPRDMTPTQVFTRNKRIHDNQKWLMENHEKQN